jgi:fructose-1-phosphate kinase PfkB-like protein
LLAKKRSSLDGKVDIVKNIAYEDLMRCLDKNEAESILQDEFAEQELIKHISTKYGPVRELFHINYRTADILSRFTKHGREVTTDELMEFENSLQRLSQEDAMYREKAMLEEASFEDLVKLEK